jgi:Protein of unknown function (DUF1266)
MLRFRPLGLMLLCLLPCAAQQKWTAAQQEWSLAASGVLAVMNGYAYVPYTHLANTPPHPDVTKLILASQWGVHSRPGLLNKIAELRSTKQASQVGWNYPRIIHLARLGREAGYLREHEAWDIIVPAAQRIQAAFSSWQELGEACLTGWSSSHTAESRRAEQSYRWLVMDRQGPWRRLAWDQDLGAGKPVLPSSEKTAEVIVQPHPSGLTCVRLRLQEPVADSSVVPAISRMIGCDARVTGEGIDIGSYKGDWVVNAECVLSGAFNGTESVTRIRPEMLAKLLRTVGYTQLFSYVQHSPIGQSLLVPAAHDTWQSGGYREHVNMQWLQASLPDLTLTYGVPRKWNLRALVFSSIYLLMVAALTIAAALEVKNNPARGTLRKGLLAAFFLWFGWILLSISFHGLDLATIRTGDDGLSAQLAALTWYAPPVLALRFTMEALLTIIWARRAPNSPPLGRAIGGCFWRSLAELPLPAVIVLLTSRTFSWSFVAVLMLIGVALTVTFLAYHAASLALGAYRARSGELYDAVRGIAAHLQAPIKRLKIEPDSPWTLLDLAVRSPQELTIPRRSITVLGRQELDAAITHQLILARNGSGWIIPWAGAVLLLLWAILAYATQSVSSANASLGLLLGTGVLFWMILWGLSLMLQRRAEKQVLADPEIGEAWLSGLGRCHKLIGHTVRDEEIYQYGWRSGYPLDRLKVLLRGPHLPGPGYQVPEAPR